MLSRADNELLTRTGPGASMGRLMRRYWIPALLLQEIADPDGPPVRVRLLGEDLRFNIFFRRNRPVREDEKKLDEEIGPDHRKVRNLRNHYLQDREEQRRETFTGMGKSFVIHDSCATESMGPIFDRSREHLGTGDATVIAVRKFVLRGVKDFENGKEPPHIFRTAEENDCSHILCVVTKIDSKGDAKQYVQSLADNRGAAQI